MTHSTRHKMRHGAHTSQKPRDPFAALAASDAYCGMQIEAAKSERPFGRRAVAPNDNLCDGKDCGKSRPCCMTGLTKAEISQRRYSFLNGS